MSKKIVITGATGFIGAAIAREFLKNGDHVTVLIRTSSNVSRLSEIYDLINFVTYDRLKDVRSSFGLDADIFIHCAWRGVAGSDRNEAFQFIDNIPLAIESVDLAARFGCTRWIGLGSQAEYGNLNNRIDENSLTSPTTAYGRAKLTSGIAALGLCEAFNISGSWLRVFSTYGPDDAPHWFVPYVIREFLANRTPKLTKCEQMWDYLYVEDAARAIVSVAYQNDATGIFNLGSGSSHSLKTCVEIIRETLKTDLIPEYGAIPYRADQVMHLEADISRLSKKTGWVPLVSLQDGLVRTLDSLGSING